MLSVISGVVVVGAGGGAFWYFKPRDGKIHPLVTAPVFDSLIPIGIISALAIGLAMIVGGLTN